MLHLVVVAYALADDLLKLYAATNADNIVWHVFLHSNFPDVVQACQTIAGGNSQVKLYDYRVNRGLARSWNEGLLAAHEQGAEVALIANDDALPAPGDVQRIASYAIQHRDCYRVTGYGYDVRGGYFGDMGFSMCAVNPLALEQIGYFDENFWPIYFEDTDWYRRAQLAGLSHYMVPDTHLIHQGSKTLHTLKPADHHDRFRANRDYYLSKWGTDENEAPVFTTPFNDPNLTLKIEAQARHAPYPGHNREGIQDNG